MTQMKYRPEIDGLRALAVMGVVLYHIGLGCPGGYVGVDVFFVISGFLITGIIQKELKQGTFSMWNFWMRRIRRILPAVSAMVFVSLVLGYYILDDWDFITLGKSAVAQSVMAANIYFWRFNLSYFAGASDMKPLLHTWSLAVEEQFYVLFPLLLLAISTRFKKHTITFVVLIGIGSLMFSCWALLHRPGYNFFLLPTRAWELMAGAVLALMPTQKESPKKCSEVASWGGLLMIIATMFLYNDKTPFPGWYAIPPVAGSALFLWGNQSLVTSAGKLLSMKLIVLIGLISYSLYLWHWTVLVFTKHVVFDVSSLTIKVLILVLSILVAVCSWKWIEMPFRKRGRLEKRKSAYTFAASATMFIVILGIIIIKLEGLPGRFADGLDLLREDMTPVSLKLSNEKRIGSPAFKSDGETMVDFVIWGDSHAMVVSELIDKTAKKYQLSGAAYMKTGGFPVTGLTAGWLLNQETDYIEYSEKVIEQIFESRAKNVILIAHWSACKTGKLMEKNEVHQGAHKIKSIDLFRDHLIITVDRLTSHGVNVWIMKQVPEQPNDDAARQFYLWKKYPLFNQKPGQFTVGYRQHVLKQADINRVFDDLSLESIRVIDPTLYFFKDKEKLKVYDQRSYYRDIDHLTRAGADYYLADMFDHIFAQISDKKKMP